MDFSIKRYCTHNKHRATPYLISILYLYTLSHSLTHSLNTHARTCTHKHTRCSQFSALLVRYIAISTQHTAPPDNIVIVEQFSVFFFKLFRRRRDRGRRHRRSLSACDCVCFYYYSSYIFTICVRNTQWAAFTTEYLLGIPNAAYKIE